MATKKQPRRASASRVSSRKSKAHGPRGRKGGKHGSHALVDHDEIRRWAEDRGARPARVKGTGGEGDVGMIRLDFPGFSGEESLEPISWEEFFEKFDEGGLALLVQEETASGEKSNFNKLVKQETVKKKAA